MGYGTVRVIIAIDITMDACADACLHIWCAGMHALAHYEGCAMCILIPYMCI